MPTSFKIAPLFSMISEMRKEPPISTICPLEQITSEFEANVLMERSTAAALLLTINELSEPQIDAIC